MRLTDCLENRCRGLAQALHVIGPGIAQQQMALTGVLTMGEQQHALFAQCITAVSGEHMHQIMRVAQAETIPLDQIGPDLPAGLVKFLHQSGSGQPFAFHKIAIGVRDGIGRQEAQCIVIVQQSGQFRFIPAQLLTPFAQCQCANPRNEIARRQGIEYLENLCRVFLVFQQGAEMAPRF